MIGFLMCNFIEDGLDISFRVQENICNTYLEVNFNQVVGADVKDLENVIGSIDSIVEEYEIEKVYYYGDTFNILDWVLSINAIDSDFMNNIVDIREALAVVAKDEDRKTSDRILMSNVNKIFAMIDNDFMVKDTEKNLEYLTQMVSELCKKHSCLAEI